MNWCKLSSKTFLAKFDQSLQLINTVGCQLVSDNWFTRPESDIQPDGNDWMSLLSMSCSLSSSDSNGELTNLLVGQFKTKSSSKSVRRFHANLLHSDATCMNKALYFFKRFVKWTNTPFVAVWYILNHTKNTIHVSANVKSEDQSWRWCVEWDERQGGCDKRRRKGGKTGVGAKTQALWPRLVRLGEMIKPY